MQNLNFKSVWLEWWQHSQIFASLTRIATWKQTSFLVGNLGLGSLLIILLVILPFLSNEQIGILTAVIAVFWLPSALGNRTIGSNVTPIHLPLGIYWLVVGVATLASPVKKAAADGWVKLTLYFLVFLAFHSIMRLSKVKGLNWRSLLVGTYLLTALVVMVYGLRQWFYGVGALATWVDATSEFAGTTRIFSFLDNPNLLAGYLMPVFPLATVAAIQWRGWGIKILTSAIAFLGALSVILTFSRGGLIGLAVESIVLIGLLGYWWSDRLAKWVIPTFISTSTTIMLAAVTLIPALRIRVLSIFSGRGDSSNNFRINVWMSTLNMIKARPILGIGPGNKAFNLVYPYYQRPGFSALGAYSVPLEIASEAGIIGLACYIWLLVTTVRLGWQQVQVLRPSIGSNLSLELETSSNESLPDQLLEPLTGLWLVGGLSAIAGMMGHGLVDTVWYRPQVQILWWLAIALVSSFYVSAGANSKISNHKFSDIGARGDAPENNGKVSELDLSN